MQSRMAKWKLAMGRIWLTSVQMTTEDMQPIRTSLSNQQARIEDGAERLLTEFQTKVEWMSLYPPDPTPLQVYTDLWVVKHGQEWVPVTEEMLVDNEGIEGRMTRALARANLLEQHYLVDQMVFKAKIKEGA
jgi:hypothetical protein